MQSMMQTDQHYVIDAIWHKLDYQFQNLMRYYALNNKSKFDSLCKELEFTSSQKKILFDSFQKNKFNTNYMNYNDNASIYAIPTHRNEKLYNNNNNVSDDDWSDWSDSEIEMKRKTNKKKKKNKRKRYKTVNVSDEDRHKMENICNKLRIDRVRIDINLYGYKNHVDVYLEVLDLVENYTENERKDYVSQQSTNKLRDIKCKIFSAGTIGRKHEMVHGVCQKLNEFCEQ
eukprot:329467_1